MRHRIAVIVAMTALSAACAIAEGSEISPRAASSAPSPWFLGLAVSPESFGGDLGLSDCERMSLALVLDPLPWKVAVPSLAAGVSVPLFPWIPRESLFEARLDLRLLTLRPAFIESLYDGPSEYAPSLTASLYLPIAGGDAFGSLGIRPFEFRTGDALYSFFSIAAVVSRGSDPEAAYNFRGFSVELFEFTHFFM